MEQRIALKVTLRRQDDGKRGKPTVISIIFNKYNLSFFRLIATTVHERHNLRIFSENLRIFRKSSHAASPTALSI
jgi:hypothetical protein